MREFTVGDEAAAGDLAEAGGDELARAVIEEPEAAHRGIVDDGVIYAHAETEGLDPGAEVEERIAVGHAVVAEDCELHVAVVRAGGGHELGEPRFVGVELRGNFGGKVADAVEHAVEVGPVAPRKIDFLRREVGEEMIEILALGAGGIADVVGDAALLEVIEDVGADVEAAGLERVFLLGEIEEGDEVEGDVVEIEVAAEF